MPSPSSLTICVMGAGNVGKALSADLVATGHAVRLWDRSWQRLLPVQQHGGVEISGTLHSPSLLTIDLAQAVDNADAVLVTTVANAHAPIAHRLADLGCDVPIILCPGRTGGALEVHHILAARGFANTVVEVQTSPVLTRVLGAVATLLARKVSTAAAAVDHDVPGIVREIIPSIHDVHSVLTTSFGNVGAILHPPLALIHIGAQPTTSNGLFYADPPSAALETIEHLDAERMAVAAAYGVTVPSLREWFATSYGNHLESLEELLVANPGYDAVPSPASPDTRQLTEDVPMGLVPLSAFGELAGVGMPATRMVINQACELLGRDLTESGRTLTRLGLADMGVGQIRQRWGA